MADSSTRTCRGCDGPMPEGAHFNAKFCTKECKAKFRTEYMKDYKRNRPDHSGRTCEWLECSNIIPSSDGRVKFCSDECAELERKRQVRIKSQRESEAARKERDSRPPIFGPPSSKMSNTRLLDCERCGDMFLVERRAGRPARYCGESCKADSAAEHARALARKYRGQEGRPPCYNCGAELDPSGLWTNHFCDERCKSEHMSKYRKQRYRSNLEDNRRRSREYFRAKNGIVPVSECRVCGGSIPRDRHAGLTYCSDSCKSVDYSAKAREWSRMNPEKRADISARSFAKRRAVKLSVQHEDWTRIEIAERDSWSCYLCGDAIQRDVLHIDHLIPISKGGEDAPRNLAAAHQWCNLRKNARVTQQAITKRGQNMMDSLREALQ